MNTLETQILKDRSKKRKSLVNKWILGLFLLIAFIALAMKIIDGILMDFGLLNGKIHPGFWHDPNWVLNKNIDEEIRIKTMLLHHPNTFWFLTQFTWLTTIIIIMFLFFRFFRFEDTIPRWLKWIMSQRTLSLVTMYDVVVGAVFWASMFKGFEDSFSKELFAFELTFTILVHAVIPVCILSYSLVFVIFDRKASFLREGFIIRGMIYPIFYTIYYVLLTIIWDDPYPITHMHQSIVDGDWVGWVKELWKLPCAIIAIYSLLGIMLLIHNLLLLKVNKIYDPKFDYESLKRKENRIEKIKDQVTRKYVRSMQHKK